MKNKSQTAQELDRGDESTCVTSIRMKKSLREDAKVFAIRHGLKLQELIELSLAEYMKSHETH